MRWVLITALGSLVEPEVKRNLAIVSGPTLACAASTARSARSPAARRTAPSRGLERAFAEHHRRLGGNGGGDRLRVRRAAREHQARRQQADDVLELAVVLRDQRVGRRDRRIGHAGEHRAEGEQEVLDVVVGEDDDRPLDRDRMAEQPLGDRAGGAERLGVADLAPVAALHPLGDEVRSGAPRPSAGSGRSGASA
jgi:hypothetical protein